MYKTRFECRHIIKKTWAQMTPGSETLTYDIYIDTFTFSYVKRVTAPASWQSASYSYLYL